MGDAGTVGELVALCVKGKPERVAPRLCAHAHERNRKLSEIGMQNTVHVNTIEVEKYRAQARRKPCGNG